MRVLRLICKFLAVAVLIAQTIPHASGEDTTDEYPFLAQNVQNDQFCLGLVIAISTLEEGSKIKGVEESEELAERIWTNFTTPTKDKLNFRGSVRLRDQREVAIRSEIALEEIGRLIHAKYSKTMNAILGHPNVEQPDPNTAEGLAMLKVRQSYLELKDKNRTGRVSSYDELRTLVAQDKDGLLAIACFGWRFFETEPPREIIVKFNLKPDQTSGQYPWVGSAHAILLTYDDDQDQFFAYDSNDPDRKWPVTVEGEGERFNIRWRIADYVGHGPTQQRYVDVRPLDRFLTDLCNILKAN